MIEHEKVPPQWMQSLLEHLLPAQTREEIVGDLQEEYIESILPQRGRLRADLWHARQVLSFAPAALRESKTLGKILIILSGFTMICMVWLTTMELTLQHPGYGMRMVWDICFVIVCLLTVFLRMLPSPRTLGEVSLRGSALLMIVFGAATFLKNAHAAHFEGYAFIISLLLMAQGILMLLTLGRRGDNARLPAK